MIISVSRRCDIPRFQFDWFLERLNEGFVDVINPFNAGQIKRVSLLPQDVDAFVFWTRDPKQILLNADEIAARGYPFYVMVSVTGYPDILEPNMPPASQVIASMKELTQKFMKNYPDFFDRLIWRYDPIILTNATDIDFHLRNFNDLSQKLNGSVKHVIISIYDEYKRAAKRLCKLEADGKLRMLNIEDEKIKNSFYGMIESMAKIACDNGMHIQSCAEKENFSPLGIKPGACIDASLIQKICGAQAARDKNMREDCLCCKSIDIGSYNTCAARCVYCYAS